MNSCDEIVSLLWDFVAVATLRAFLRRRKGGRPEIPTAGGPGNYLLRTNALLQPTVRIYQLVAASVISNSSMYIVQFVHSTDIVPVYWQMWLFVRKCGRLPISRVIHGMFARDFTRDAARRSPFAVAECSRSDTKGPARPDPASGMKAKVVTVPKTCSTNECTAYITTV